MKTISYKITVALGDKVLFVTEPMTGAHARAVVPAIKSSMPLTKVTVSRLFTEVVTTVAEVNEDLTFNFTELE
jgi:hypothetical protein